MCGFCSRRTVLWAGLTFLWPRLLAAAVENIEPITCGFTQAEFDKVRSSMRSMPGGDEAFHQPLIGELDAILSLFNVEPGFQYIDADNAFAINLSFVPGTRGTVLIGVPYIRQLLSPNDGGISVAGVLAHECAHILQYFSHYNDKLKGPTAASRELHADLLAGYYLCKKKGLVPQEVTPFQRTLMQGGTYNRSSTQFHGTPNQRGAAMDRGFMYAMDGKSLQEAARDGAEYVLRLLQ